MIIINLFFWLHWFHLFQIWDLVLDLIFLIIEGGGGPSFKIQNIKMNYTKISKMEFLF